MPRQKIEYLALLSSPSGLEDDREAVGLAIEEINANLQHENIGVYLKDWKRDIAPGATSDAQMRINEGIVDSVDLIIALLHVRAGEKTARFRSGTIEEIDRVLKRKERGENVEVMIYFKKAKVDPDDIDLDQLAAVRRFRDEMRSRVHYGEYEELSDLGAKLRRAVPDVLRNLGGTSSVPNSAYRHDLSKPVVEFWSDEKEEDDIEDGALDAEDRFSAAMRLLGDSFEIIGAAIRGLSAETPDVAAAAQSVTPTSPFESRKGVADRGAEMLERFNRSIEPGVAKFAVAAKDVPVATSAFLIFLQNSPPEELSALSATVRGVVDELQSQVQTVMGFRATLSGLPRLTKRLNEARRRGTRFLETLSGSMQSLADELLLVVGEIDKGRS